MEPVLSRSYAPASNDQGHIVLLASVCLSDQNLTLKLNISLLLLN